MVCPVSGSVADLEGRIFLRQLLDRHAQLFLIGLGLGLDRELNHRHREVDRLENDRDALSSQIVSPVETVLQTHGGANIAGHDLLNVFALIGVHAQQAADALFAALGHIEHRLAGRHLSRIDAEKGQLAGKRVGHDLEHQRRERLGIRRMRAPS